MTLTIQDLCKQYHSHTVLDHVSLVLASGHTYILMSPSGSGKTTLFRIILNLEAADSGTITGLENQRLTAVFQEDRLCESASPLENVRMVTGKEYSQQELLSELSLILPEECLLRPVSTLSGGMKRRVAICRAILAPSDGILMDEPFAGLDEETKQTVITYIKARTARKLVMISTHQEEDLAAFNGILLTLPGRNKEG